MSYLYFPFYGVAGLCKDGVHGVPLYFLSQTTDLLIPCMPVTRSVESAIPYSLKIFIAPLETDSKFVHSAIANSTM